MDLWLGAGEGCLGGRLMEWREGGYNLGESYSFKALLFEKYKPQMNPCESRFTETGTRMTRIWRICTDTNSDSITGATYLSLLKY